MGYSRILVLMDNREDENWGSQASTSALFGLLGEKFPGAEIRGVPRSAARPSGFVVRRLAELNWRGLASGSSRGPAARGLARALTQTWASDYDWAELVVVNGEGTLHPQRQTRRWLAAIAAARRRAAKPLWIVNASISFAGSPDRPEFERFLRSPEFVAVREPVTFRELASLGFDPVQAADCAFLTDTSRPPDVDPILSRLGVTPPFGVVTGSAAIREWRRGEQRRVVSHLLSRGLGVLVAASSVQDRKNFAELDLGVPLLTERDIGYLELTAVQSRAEILVGGRFHPTILAALVGTPFVAVTSNIHKMEGLMEMLRCEELLFSIGDTAGMLEKVDEVLDNRARWSSRLKQSAESCAALARLNAGP